MAKRQKSFSYVHATEALEQLARRGTSAQEFVYGLLRVFAGYGDGQIRRTKEGAGNLAKDGKTVLIKNLLAYRSVVEGDMYAHIEDMRHDAKIAKQSPRLYIVSDGQGVVAYDPKENDWYENSIALLWKDFEFFTPLAGIEKIQYTEEAEADVKSAELMAKLFDDIRRYNDIRNPETVHALNVFMSRLLFCFFAEDTGLFPIDNLFTNTLKTHTKEDGSDLAEFIDHAFLAMSTTDAAVLDTLPKLYEVFPYVNGGLFKDRYPIPVLSRRARTLILNCGEYNWREINPDIFGSMIQAVVTPEQRAGLGMHYTSVPNIEKLIKPLFLDALEEEFEAACAEAREKIAKNTHPDRAAQRLRNLLTRLSNIKFFDPACGSGNFLIISYKRLRELEIRIWKALKDIKILDIPFPNISLSQFYGIELDAYACDTATLSLWLAEHQMNVRFKEELYVLPQTLPLKPSGHIVCGNACRLDWNTVCPHKKDDEVYIMGNPPYMGNVLQGESHKKDLQIALDDLKDRKGLDYIAAWFWQGSKYIKGTISKFAFVTTNSISQGEQVAMLWKPIIDLGLEISFARTSFKWSNNAKYNAAVTVVIIGVQDKTDNGKIIFNEEANTQKKVSKINPYLTEGEVIIVEKKYSAVSSVPPMHKGSMPADNGALVVSKGEYDNCMAQYPELKKYIKLYLGSDEFINGIERYCFWIEDDEYIKCRDHLYLQGRFNSCRVFREKSTKASTRLIASEPYRFDERRHRETDAILVPSVSSERRQYIPIGYVDKGTVISNLAFAIYDAEKWLFAILMSKLHNVWVRNVCGALETRLRYSNTLGYNTFPFPKLSEAQKETLSQLAQHILDIRIENFDMPLGKMYNQESMPEELRNAHRQLDLAVERIYRPEPFASDEERLEYLFKLYAKMTKK